MYDFFSKNQAPFRFWCYGVDFGDQRYSIGRLFIVYSLFYSSLDYGISPKISQKI